jgi:hypothetical protein|tara:strand:- start:7066 stop:7623 length:558 start_codon:yes stop_codon:yes gene_type:complete
MNSLLEDMEEEFSKPTIGDNSLKEVSGLCSELSSEQSEYEELEKMLKEKAKSIRKLSEEIIPARMAELGLESLTLKDGSQIKVKQKVQASIPIRFREDAFQWLRENGHGDLIKNQVSATFGKGEDMTASEFVNKVQELGYDPQQKLWVEPMTLKAFVREQINEGKEIPMEKFGVFVGAETKISKK